MKLMNRKVIKLTTVLFNAKKIEDLRSGIITRKIHQTYFETDDEVMENVLGNFMTIGINLPGSKNKLTETALIKLIESIKNFDENKQIHTGILHGCGGNFCTGVVETKEAAELGQNLIKTLHTLKKPIIAALDGHTIDFGHHLSVMCDMRVMDKSALAGLQNKTEKFEIPSFLYERLILTIGVALTTEIMCSRHMWTATECFAAGLVNKIADYGCALGQAMLLAQNIAFNNSMDSIIQQKSRILSFLNKGM